MAYKSIKIKTEVLDTLKKEGVSYSQAIQELGNRPLISASVQEKMQKLFPNMKADEAIAHLLALKEATQREGLMPYTKSVSAYIADDEVLDELNDFEKEITNHKDGIMRGLMHLKLRQLRKDKK